MARLRLRFSLWVGFGLIGWAIVRSGAAEPVGDPAGAERTAEAEQLLVHTVGPLLVAKCGGCHGDAADGIKGDFDLRSRAAMLAGGESGERAVDFKALDESVLVKAIEWRDGWEMPPKENDRLTAEQIAAVRTWLAAGAPWPSDARAAEIRAEGWAAGEADGVLVNTRGGTSDAWTNRRYAAEDLWAYQPLADVEVPWREASAASHPIDAFIARRQNQQGIEPLPEADPAVLLRRLTFDLTGLPPTPEEMARFLSDDRPDRWKRTVERLLACQAYGEQAARHWLDVVRYADTAGFANDYLRPNAWRYRDYVVRAFNEDKPYDEFVRQQVAGDERNPRDPESLIAVGYLRMGPWEHTAMSVEAVTRQQFLDDVTNSVGVTFLGQELRCAKCHDHKFDPIPTIDYYAMQAIFAPVQFADRDVPFLPEENRSGFAAGKARIEALQSVPGVESLKTIPKELWPVDSFDEETDEKGRQKVRRKREQTLAREIARFAPQAMSVYSGPPRTINSNKPRHPLPPEKQRQGQAETIHVLTGGSIESPAQSVEPGVLSVLEVGDDAFAVPTATEGRRAALASWLTHPEHPLTARVMVNRVWQQHFGRGLAANPNNFGATGKKPTHPELLDYLARWFIDHDWSLKQLHTLIVTSQAYRRAAGPRPAALQQQDPAGELYAWFEPRRLTAEELRDAMLQATGELNLQGGGLPARPEINLEVAMQPRHIMGSVAPAYQPSPTPTQRNKRTIYCERIRTLRDPLLEVFNQPGPDVSCERRDASTITPQAFTLLNSQASFDRALALAHRVSRSERPIDARIERMFELTLGRAPEAEELRMTRKHFQGMRAEHRRQAPSPVEPPKLVIREMVEEMTGQTFYWVEDLDIYRNYTADLKPWQVDAETRALAEVALVLFNSNEFIYVY